ncbi:MAG: mandelate racemase/muconate lactonizing enzyme family protein [Aggregatilineales bacterium]
MKIKRVQAFPLRYPEPNDYNNLRMIALVKIEAEDGTVGWGECISMWPEATRAVKVLVEEGLASLLIGRDALDNGALLAAMKEHCWWYGDTGMALFAISACDMALWDLKGKLLGLPLHQLLGGKLTNTLRACASTHPSKARIEDLARELAEHVERGYTAVKVGFGKTGEANLGVAPQRDIAYVKAVREAIGPDVDFMVDIGKKTRWDATLAIRMVQAFEEYNIRWIEDPLPLGDDDGYRRLRAATKTPIATGEREWTPAGYARLIEAGVGDIYLVDPGRVEGVSGFARVIALAAAAHRQINAHSWSSALNTAASIHLTATAANHIVMEIKPIPNPMQHELAREPFEQKDGFLTVPDAPGLGVEVDEAVVERYGFR